MIRDFFLGFIKIHILHHAAEEAIYGVAIMTELRRHGYDVSPGTLYPVLHGLQRSGYLRRVDRVVDGKIRKYYTITSEGRRILSAAREQIGELVHEVLQGREPVIRSRRAKTTRQRHGRLRRSK